MYPIGLSSCGFALTEENFSALQNSGIAAIEISMRPELYPAIDYAQTLRLSRDYGVKLWSYHLPFVPFEELEPSALDPSLRADTVAYFTQLIQKGTQIGIDKFVIHPSGEPIPDAQREERLRYAMDSLDILAEVAHREGARIAVENLPRTCLGRDSGEILRLISANDKLGVCFDTNHLLREDTYRFLERLSGKLLTVHISDYDYIDERHWLPGEGKLDWPRLHKALEKAGYTGAWVYELGQKTPQSLVRPRVLNFGDFYANATAIFEGRQPAPFGTPNL